MGPPLKNRFSKMTDAEIYQYLGRRYSRLGVAGIEYRSLATVKGLYHVLYQRGFRIKDIVRHLGIEEEYQEKRKRVTSGGDVLDSWSWARVLRELDDVVDEAGFLPTAGALRQSGYGSLVQYVYDSGKSWADLRSHYNSDTGSSFVESRGGHRWRSHPEASLANFLYARGIRHKVGERYPADYETFSGRAYGMYDLHFVASDGRWIDVEIWGDKPNGHAVRDYAKKRQMKEAFNRRNPNYLGIEFEDCYHDESLSRILEPYIGEIEPFIFSEPSDKLLQTAHWSNADELLDACRQLASQQPDGIFPTEEWLRKRGKWAARPGPPYNTISVYIKKWIGGVRNLRKILGQEHASTMVWDSQKATREYL